MALINCPECKKSISDQSSSCPGCGYPLKSNDTKIVVKRPQGCFMQTLNIGCMIVLILGVLFLLNIAILAIGAYTSEKDNKNVELTKTNENN